LDSANAREQRVRFRKLIEQIVGEHEIQFIGEEWGDVETTFAEALAEKAGITWRNINTSQADKVRLGIPLDYASGPHTLEAKARWNEMREHFMFERIWEHMCKLIRVSVLLILAVSLSGPVRSQNSVTPTPPNIATQRPDLLQSNNRPETKNDD